MSKPSQMNHNPCPESFVVWCQSLDKEAISRAILQSTTTQMQFRTGDPADDSATHRIGTAIAALTHGDESQSPAKTDQQS